MSGTRDRTPGDDAEHAVDREVTALRAELRAGGLLPDLPSSYEPTEASAEAMLQRVLASRIPVVEEPVAVLAQEPAQADAGLPDDAVRTQGDARRAARQTAAEARRRRATLTQTLFGLAATVLVAAVIVVPLSRSGGESASDAGSAPTAGHEAVQRTGEGLGTMSPQVFDEAPVDLAPLVGTVVDLDGCLAVQQEETGTLYIPVDTPGTAVRAQLQVGERVSVEHAELDLIEDTEVPAGCDPAGPFWPATSLTVLP